jgi:adenine-specific DNA-methyltransferase
MTGGNEDMTDAIQEPEKLDLTSHDVAAERREELLRLFPEAHTEGGKIDFARLQLALGETVDTGRERYGLTWPGKADCFRTIQAPSVGTLRPDREESVDFDTTENLIIEGDNLEVLKLLQKSYLGKVKMIYIDPPYNTGNDFIYPDDYSESLQTYLEYTGQVDSEGRRFGTNTEAEGRFHSKWLNMMYPRLYLARNLLEDDGAIFVSCDDAEAPSLRLLLNELFGEETFVAQFVWRARQFTDTRATTNVSTDHEYILAYAKNPELSLRGRPRDESKFTNPDDDPRGPWMSRSILGLAAQEQRPNLHYDIVDPATGRVYPPNPATGWRYASERMSRLIDEDRLLFPAKIDGRPREKKFRQEMRSELIAFRSIIDNVHTADGTQEVRALLGSDLFPFPKPSKLIRSMVDQVLDENDLVLDFFAGSGTTAQAVLESNSGDAGTRRFILVQLPEPTGRDDYPTIADITKERVKRVIKKLNKEDAGRLDLDGSGPQDRGFRAFSLAESNFKPWKAERPDTPEGLAEQLELHVAHIREGRTAEDLLHEILLKSGYPLTAQVEMLELAGKAVYSVADGNLFVCLDRDLTLDLVRAMAERQPVRVVCLDEGFAGNDQLKANAVQIFKTKGVTSFKTV